MNNLSLLPQPRSLKFTTGQHALQPLKYILLDAPEASQLVFSGRLLKDALKDYGEVVYMLSASVGGPSEDFGVVLRQVEDPAIPDQGYRLSIQPDQITVEASSPAGIFYGVATLSQVLKQSGQNLPCLEISDWPDFPARGYMLDISRDKVPTMETLLQLIDKLAAWKYNQLQLYTEHTFAYLNHPVVWSEATPMTGQDILEPLLQRALYRTGAEPEFVRPHEPLADPHGIRSPGRSDRGLHHAVGFRPRAVYD